MKRISESTLFRFITLRSPEHYKQESKKFRFIEHPNPATSTIEGVLPLELEANLVKIQNQGIELDQYSQLIDLGNWLTSNSTNITLSEFLDKSIGTVVLPEEDEILIWDLLIVQCFADLSSNLESKARSILLANHHIKHIDEETTEEDLKATLRAQIVIPKYLLDRTIKDPAKSTDDISLTTKQSFNEVLDAVESMECLTRLESLLSGILTAQDDYYQSEKESEAEYLNNYSEQLSSYNQAIEVSKITYFNKSTVSTQDSQSNTEEMPLQVEPIELQVNESEGTLPTSSSSSGIESFMGDAKGSLPSYQYQPAAEIDPQKIMNFLSEESQALFDEINGGNQNSFDSLIQLIRDQIEEHTKNLFEIKPLNQTYTSLKGAIIPASFEGKQDDHSFIGKVYSLAGSQHIKLAVKVSSATRIKCLNYTVKEGENIISEGTNGSFTNSYNGIIGIDLMPTGTPIPSNVSFEMSLTTDLNQNFKLNGVIHQDQVLSGMLEEVGLKNSADNESKIDRFGVVKLGIADYRKVDQHLCCYVPGEVSHIENLMAREYKEKTTSRLLRSEETFNKEVQTESEKLTDTSSTQRFEMNQEIAVMMNESFESKIESGINWKGPSISGHIDSTLALNKSKDESNRMAKTTAQEVTQRAQERVVEKIKTSRISKVIEEFSEQNTHGFDNRKGENHLAGVYRWIDKIYRNEIKNYGKRLMYEFMIPEPGSFHKQAITNRPKPSSLIKPLDPRKHGLATYKSINEFNAGQWAAKYNVDIPTAPEENRWLGKSYSKSQQQGDGDHSKNKAITDSFDVPDGYSPIKAIVTTSHEGHYIGYSIANQSFKSYSDQSKTIHLATYANNGMAKMPISIMFEWIWVGNVVINVQFKRTKKLYEKWQMDTFHQIIKAYENQLETYERKLANELAAQVDVVDVNPDYYREIEQMVLKKNAIDYLLEEGDIGLNFQVGTTVQDHSINQNKLLADYTGKVKFLEQAFEWDIMGYQFYPFYWGNRSDWGDLYLSETKDKLFTKFLQSGMARVIVSVRPGFEDAVNWFMETGNVWQGSAPPIIGDDLYLSIADELDVPESVVEGSWESRIPSTLTILQNGSIGLQADGLPCLDECSGEDLNMFVQDDESLSALDVIVPANN